jgi:bifunctional non-homologous end joining protein LigD
MDQMQHCLTRERKKSMADSATIAIKGRQVKLTNLDRVLWPDDGYTKRDLVEYYAAVFPFMGPHLKQRPLVFNRYPNGIKEDSFFQKNAPAYTPDWIKTYAWEGARARSKTIFWPKARPI